MLKTLYQTECSGCWLVSDIELRKQTGGNGVMNRWRLLTSMCFGNVCLADKQWLAHGQAGGCQSGNPSTPPWLPPPPAPPSVSDAAWPVHTSCLCGPGMPRIQTAALLPAAAQQGTLTPPPHHPPSHPSNPPPLQRPSGFTAQSAGCLGGCVWFDVVLSLHTVTSPLQSGATTPALRKWAVRSGDQPSTWRPQVWPQQHTQVWWGFQDGASLFSSLNMTSLMPESVERLLKHQGIQILYWNPQNYDCLRQILMVWIVLSLLYISGSHCLVRGLLWSIFLWIKWLYNVKVVAHSDIQIIITQLCSSP